jgi:hypothetical protein
MHCARSEQDSFIFLVSTQIPSALDGMAVYFSIDDDNKNKALRCRCLQ